MAGPQHDTTPHVRAGSTRRTRPRGSVVAEDWGPLLAEGIVSRGIASGALDVEVHDLRDHTSDRHRSVDDQPFGGGPGMVMKAEPFLRAINDFTTDPSDPPAFKHAASLAPQTATIIALCLASPTVSDQNVASVTGRWVGKILTGMPAFCP